MLLPFLIRNEKKRDFFVEIDGKNVLKSITYRIEFIYEFIGIKSELTDRQSLLYESHVTYIIIGICQG